MRTAVLLLALALATPLLAEEGKAEPSARIVQWLKSDNDGDGKLSRAETSGLMARFFDRNDTDDDGFLTRRELEALDKRLGSRDPNRSENPRARALPEGVELRRNLVYRDGHERWKADLYLPEGKAPEGGRPGIVFVHGGGWRSGSKDGGQWARLPAEYAAKGYVCLSVNYRLTTDGGGFPNCVHDVKNAVRWFRAQAGEIGLDPHRIGAYGNSAGAHLVSMLGLVPKEAGLEGDGPHQEQSSLVQAVCASATPADFPNWPGFVRNRGLLEGSEEGLEERGVAASPVTHVGADSPPFLLVHARDDRTVPFAQGQALADALTKTGNEDVTLMAYDKGGHGVFGQKGTETYPAMEAFFARVLKSER